MTRAPGALERSTEDPTTLAVVETLRGSPLFFDLPAETLSWLAGAAELRGGTEGATLFRLGDRGDEMFVVGAGEIEILVPGRSGAPTVLSRLGSGDWFGEMALLTGEARSATARVAADVQLAVISREIFRTLLTISPEIGIRLSDELSRRLRSQTLRHSTRAMPRLLLVDGIAEGADAAAALAAFVSALGAEVEGEVALFAGGEALPLASPRIRRSGAARSPDEVADAVRRHRLTIVSLQAPGALADALRRLPAIRVAADDVVGVHRREAARSLPPLFTPPMQRLARSLLGRTVALVLGAGGAKGFCHIGVIRALERAGVKVDMIVGTSIGALIGGFAARPASADELHEGFRPFAERFRREVIDLRLFGPSLLRGHKKARLLAEYALGLDIEDLPVPFRAVAADLVSAREIVIGTGPLARAMDAATAVPTIFPPIAVGAQRLVDGWMLDPVPADVACAEGAARVIAVDPTAADRSAPVILARRGRRGVVGRISKLFDLGARLRIAMRAMDVSARDRAAAARPLIDVCIEPPLAPYASTDVRRFDDIIAVGEQAAEARMAAIREAIRDNLPAAAPGSR